MYTGQRRFGAVVILATILASAPVLAQCSLEAHIDSRMNTGDPSLGGWVYTLTVDWNTGSQYALSHLNLWLDEGNQNCLCSDIGGALNLPAESDPTEGTPTACDLVFESLLECNGDPSIGLTGTIIKFEPFEGEGCEAGVSGTMTYTFYSDFAPSNIYLPNMYLTDKAGQTACSGQITGVFPGLPCDPTPVDNVTWGGIKLRYGR